ncbi:HAD family phosphatase [Corynebacterium amycolatum]|uniref:HAD family phosphatase n=1 Tax=Corynebacterium amycolatum TaxID=43765 RepID=A0A7T4KPN8_CORAY|nr:HAD family phosphatase [Corynebacterium amycolatum]QQB82297.1 HAD family phosphatase [Corynebacterium amycolatum]
MKAILWDMDGSLISTEPLWEIATYDLSEFVGRRLTPELRMQCVGNTLWDTLSICADHAGRTLDDELFSSGSQFVENRFTELVLEHGVEWRPGVPEILEQARAADIPVVLVTNTRRHVAQPCIDVMGEQHFAATVCSDEVANGKPAPDPYLRGAALAGFAPEDCLAIEDSSTGVRSALAAGCTVVWNPMPDVSVSQADVETLVPPARFISGNLDTSNLGLLRAAFAGE